MTETLGSVSRNSAAVSTPTGPPPAERQALLNLLVQSPDPHDELARDPAKVARLISATRRRGYGLRQGGGIWPHTGSVALPIRAGGRLLGCISTIWMARVLTAAEGVRRCLPPLREAQTTIEQQLAEESGADRRPADQSAPIE